MGSPAYEKVIRMKSDGNGQGICCNLVTICEGKAGNKNLTIELEPV